MADKEATVQIRPMNPSDINAITAIDHKIRGEQRALTYQDFATQLIGGQIDLSFVAEAKEQIVGFVLAWVTYVPEEVSTVCLIQILGVDPDYWRQGIATKLIQALVDKTHSRGVRIVRIMIHQQDKELQGLFERLEFHRGYLVDYSRVV